MEKLTARLPDGIFSYKKSQLWYIMVGLGMKSFGMHTYVFYGHLEYELCDHLVHFMAI
jgi:hypothetical protein